MFSVSIMSSITPDEMAQATQQHAATPSFDLLEKRLPKIRYFYLNADLPFESRHRLAYRKLMDLNCLTPRSARDLLSQWQHSDPARSQADMFD